MTPSKILQALLGVTVCAGFFALMLLVAREAVPPENKDLFLLLAGNAAGAFIAVVQFAFGSSVGSQRKDELPPRGGLVRQVRDER